ncbi:MAG TPA: DUF971 domain-containing protein [Planctomycetaceae bacterium]|nr:DUF971 domain-containing protein [Planctomycetaceae bacterium]
MNEDVYPVGLERVDETTVRVQWSDGEEQTLTGEALRNHCPCATCREKRSAPPPDPLELPIVGDSPAVSARAIVSMRPVGNYAYQVTFGDGHDTGIFTFELLRSLKQP